MKRLLWMAVLPLSAAASEIGLVGLSAGKALLVIDGAAPKFYAMGSTLPDGRVLQAHDGESVLILEKGRRAVLRMGEYEHRSFAGTSNKIVLTVSSDGHFYANGAINGIPVRMLLDTGATLVAMSAENAMRMGIDYRAGQLGYTNTANGTSTVYRVKLSSIRVGEIELSNVDATVHEHGLPTTLLGMSFLNRMDMLREGNTLTLTRRY